MEAKIQGLTNFCSTAVKQIPQVFVSSATILQNMAHAASQQDGLNNAPPPGHFYLRPDPGSATPQRKMSVPAILSPTALSSSLSGSLNRMASSVSIAGEAGAKMDAALSLLNINRSGGASPVPGSSLSQLNGTLAVSQTLPSFINPQELRYSGRLSAANLGSLNPELYKCPEEGDLAEYPHGNIGRLWFSLEYDNASEKLTVSVIKVRNLPSRDISAPNVCDPFVRVYLLPDERKYLQTKIRRKSCNPKFEESFSFEISRESFEERSLKFVVMDIDNLKRNIPLGRVIFALKDYPKTKQQRLTTWRDLAKDDVGQSCTLGEVHCSISYNGNLERLTVVVIEAKELKPFDDHDELDTYCKASLIVCGKTVKTKKTRVLKKCFSPVYNESFMFKLAPSKLDYASVSIQVLQCKHRQIGRIVIGGQMFTKGKLLQHWQDMIAKEKEVVQDWHYLTE